MTSPHRPRVIVMTGATSGIGAVALGRLAGRGDRLIVGARSTSAEPSAPEAEVRELELTSLSSVRAFAASVLEGLDGVPIDALVLNAGASFSDTSVRSADGWERTFAGNHLAHYVLARELLPAIAEGGRIVITASDTHDPRLMPGAPTTLDIETWAHGSPATMQAYTASKLANILTAESLAELPEVTDRRIVVIAYNPGFTPGTGLMGSVPAAGRAMIRLMRPIFALVGRFRPIFHINSVDNAGTVLAELIDGTVTPPDGRVYASIVREKLEYPDPSELARDPQAREELWRRSAELTGMPVA